MNDVGVDERRVATCFETTLLRFALSSIETALARESAFAAFDTCHEQFRLQVRQDASPAIDERYMRR